MSEQPKLSKLEHLKEGSRQLRGTLVEELANDEPNISGDAAQLIKHHGSYQQDNRDERGGGQKAYSFMVRTRMPGGRATAAQFLAELDLADRFGNGTVRLTTRQGFQLHGVLKQNLRDVIRGINESKLSTIAACGDVSRNTMCCPAPIRNNPVRDEMQRAANALADHLKPRTTAYYDIWLKDENGESTKVDEFTPVEEPIYGARYLPRKFKIGFALPEDNCIDVYSQDLGFVVVVENDTIVGYNVLVGGGMGTTPAKKETFPAVAHRMTFVTPDQVIAVAEAVVKVQRDFGNRADRKQARMKYLIANWGLEAFKAKVEEYFGGPLPEPHPSDVHDVDDHMGWHEQGDGRWFYGLNVENGRVHDVGDLRLKTGLRALLTRFPVETRLTALQGVLFCDIEESDKAEFDRILAEHGITPSEQLTPARRYSMACPALPTCGLAVTESERVMPGIMDQIEAEMGKYDLASERIAVHMTGCPNGCARPYTPDVGLVGKAKGKYTLFLGGNAEGTRLAYLYRDLVPLEEIGKTLSPALAYFRNERQNGESFGDFCHRMGKDDVAAFAEGFAA